MSLDEPSERSNTCEPPSSTKFRSGMTFPQRRSLWGQYTATGDWGPSGQSCAGAATRPASHAWARLRPLESQALASWVPVRGVAPPGLGRHGDSPCRGSLAAADLPASRLSSASGGRRCPTSPLWRSQRGSGPRYATKKAPPVLFRETKRSQGRLIAVHKDCPNAAILLSLPTP